MSGVEARSEGSGTPQAGDPEGRTAFWQALVFLGAVVLLIVRAPHLAAALGFLGLVVLVHEFGHFVVARWQGMRVETFSLGFGPPLVKFEWGGTAYQIAPILLGGYMKPAGENPESDEEILNAPPDEFMGRPWWSRALVAMAGPLANFLFPVAALFLLYACAGRLNPQGPPEVQAVFADSGAHAAGLLPGDLVVKINGEQVNGITGLAGMVDRQSRLNPGHPLDVRILRAGKPLELEVRSTLNASAGKYLMGVTVQESPPPFTTTLRAPEVMTPAEKAGFKAGDVVLSVDGHPLSDGYDFSALFAHSAHDPVAVKVRRGSAVLTLFPAKKQPLPSEFDPALVGLLGLDFVPADPADAQRRESLSPGRALEWAGEDTLALGFAVVVSVKALVLGEVSARDSLGGPVAILRMASQQAKRGLDDLVQMMCGISMMLGLMNLLPVPILDGFTLLFCVVEGVRGRPLRLKTQVI
ncbi:MAG: RIP metalloprotease RseP, partial [bacterium]